jgi:hypothetical protein
MRTLTALAGLAAALLSTSAMANEPIASLANAELHLAGTIASKCSITVAGSPDTSFNLDLGANRTNQDAGLLSFHCNSPYTMKVSTTYGRLVNTTAGATNARNEALTISYAINFFGTRTYGDGITQQTIRAAATSPQTVLTVSDWNALDEYGRQFDLNMQVNLVNPATGLGVADFYTDTLVFTVAAEL